MLPFGSHEAHSPLYRGFCGRNQLKMSFRSFRFLPRDPPFRWLLPVHSFEVNHVHLKSHPGREKEEFQITTRLACSFFYEEVERQAWESERGRGSACSCSGRSWRRGEQERRRSRLRWTGRGTALPSSGLQPLASQGVGQEGGAFDKLTSLWQAAARRDPTARIRDIRWRESIAPA